MKPGASFETSVVGPLEFLVALAKRHIDQGSFNSRRFSGRPSIVRIPVSSTYMEVRMNTSGPYALVKARKDNSGICTPTGHKGLTYTLHVTYTIDKHSLHTRFPCAIYTTRTISTSRIYARTIYAPTYVYNQCQRITCTIYVPNLCVQPKS